MYNRVRDKIVSCRVDSVLFDRFISLLQIKYPYLNLSTFLDKCLLSFVNDDKFYDYIQSNYRRFN